MKKTPIVLSVIAVIAACAGIVLWNVGFFAPIMVVEQKLGPFTVVYEQHTGDYKQTGKIFEQVQTALAREGVETRKAIGIYFDDPQRVPAEKLRSECGSVLESHYLPKAKYLISQQFKVKVIPPRQSVSADFPIKGAYSYMIGPMKAYPALRKYCAEKNYQVSLSYEIYDSESRKITYVLQIKDKE